MPIDRRNNRHGGWLKEISREQFECPTKLKAVIKELNKTRQEKLLQKKSQMMMRLEVTLRRALTVMTIETKEQEFLDLEGQMDRLRRKLEEGKKS